MPFDAEFPTSLGKRGSLLLRHPRPPCPVHTTAQASLHTSPALQIEAAASCPPVGVAAAGALDRGQECETEPPLTTLLVALLVALTDLTCAAFGPAVALLALSSGLTHTCAQVIRAASC